MLLLLLLMACTPPPDVDADGHPATSDCDDADPAVFPGAPDLLDRKDNDCDGAVDEEPIPALDAAEATARTLPSPSRHALLLLVADAHLVADPASAERLFGELAAADPRDGLALRGHAAAHLALGRLDEATRLSRRAITLAKAANDVLGEQEARTLLGEAQIRAGNVDVARDQFEEGVLRSDDGSTWGCAYQGLGELYTRLSTAEPKPPSAEELAAASPEEAYAAALKAWRAGALAEGVAWAPRVPETPAGKTLVAVLSLQAGGAVESDIPLIQAHAHIAAREYDAARAALDRVQRPTDPLDRELYALAEGWMLANANDHGTAVAVFGALLGQQPDSLLGLLGLGNSQLGAGDLDAAEATFGKVLALSPGNPYALAELSVIRLARGDAEGAEAGFEEVAAVTGAAYTCPYEGLGLVYLKQGRTDDAKKAFETAIRINPDIEYKKYNGLARIHLDAGRYDEAERLLKRSLANFPQDNPATTMLAELSRKRGDGSPGGSD